MKKVTTKRKPLGYGSSRYDLPRDPYTETVIAQQEREERMALAILEHLADAVSYSRHGNVTAAENLLEEALSVLCEGGVLQNWRVKQLLDMIADVSKRNHRKRTQYRKPRQALAQRGL